MNAELMNLFTVEGFGIGVVFLGFLFFKHFLIKNSVHFTGFVVFYIEFSFCSHFFTAAMNICPAACFFFFSSWQYLWLELMVIV